MDGDEPTDSTLELSGNGSASGAPDEGVSLFSIPDCPHCDHVREYLSSRKVSFAEYNVTEDETALRRLLWLTGSPTVPATLVNGEILVGFDPERLGEMFDGPIEVVEELTAPPDPEDADIW